MTVQRVSNQAATQFRSAGASSRNGRASNAGQQRRQGEQGKQVARQQSQQLPETFKQSVKFGVIEETDQMFMKVVDNQSNETVRVAPSRAFLEQQVQLKKMIGQFLDREA